MADEDAEEKVMVEPQDHWSSLQDDPQEQK